jgi:lysozyme family protein
MSFTTAFSHTVGLEGGYADHPADRGGKTMWGITESVARSAGYTGHMRDLPIETARQIYRRNYWDVLRLDEIDAMSPDIAEEIFDTAVNCGTGRAGKFLQRALNALGASPELVVDGAVGPRTISALRAFLERRKTEGALVVLKAIDSLQAEFYIQIVERDPSQKAFIFGWLSKRVR